jgi:flagellar protein FlaJ
VFELSRLKPAAEQKPKSKKEKSYAQGRFTKLSMSLFRRPALALSNRMPEVKQALLKSGRRDPPENYLATVMFATVCAIPASLIGVLLLLVLQTPLALILLPVPVLVFLIGLGMPWISFSSKSGSIDTELPYVISYFSILSGGGVSLLVTLRRISKVKLFPVLSKESKQILTDIDMYGLDPVSALEKEARSTPNKYLSDFLSGYTSILRSGGQLTSYMDAKIHEVFNHRLMQSRAAAGTIGIFAEAYVAATVVMGLCFYLIFTLQSVISRTGPSGISNAVYFSALFIPFISVVFFFLIDAVQVKDGPVKAFKNPIVPLLGFVAVPVIAFLPITSKLGLD